MPTISQTPVHAQGQGRLSAVPEDKIQPAEPQLTGGGHHTPSRQTSLDSILQNVSSRGGASSSLRTLRSQRRMLLLGMTDTRRKAFSDSSATVAHRNQILEKEFKRSENWRDYCTLDNIVVSEPGAQPVSAAQLPKLGSGQSEIQLYRRVRAIERNTAFRPRVSQDDAGIHFKRNNLQIGDHNTRPNFWTTYDGQQFSVHKMFPREEPHHASDVLLADLMRLSAIKQQRGEGAMGAKVWIVPQNIMHTSLSNERSVKIIDEFCQERGINKKQPQVIRARRPALGEDPALNALYTALTETPETNGKATAWLVRDLGIINGGCCYEIDAVEVIITDRAPPGRLYDLNFILTEKTPERFSPCDLLDRGV